jgi:hypothetical protein
MPTAIPNDLVIYAKPAATVVTLQLDDGRTLNAETMTANGRDDAHRLVLPAGCPVQGGVLAAAADGYQRLAVRGIVMPTASGPASFVFDDFGALAPAAAPAPDPKPPVNPDLDPAALCEAVYAQGDYDLATKEGCGRYTEACCTALHDQQSAWWGHIRKDAAQNQFNGHAVDALMLMTQAGGTAPGIYDIIWSTESLEAAPAWSYKGPPDAGLWYYPAAPLA